MTTMADCNFSLDKDRTRRRKPILYSPRPRYVGVFKATHWLTGIVPFKKDNRFSPSHSKRSIYGWLKEGTKWGFGPWDVSTNLKHTAPRCRFLFTSPLKVVTELLSCSPCLVSVSFAKQSDEPRSCSRAGWQKNCWLTFDSQIKRNSNLIEAAGDDSSQLRACCCLLLVFMFMSLTRRITWPDRVVILGVHPVTSPGCMLLRTLPGRVTFA